MRPSTWDGEVTVQVDHELVVVRAGEAAFAPSGTPHTLANPSETQARIVIICTRGGLRARVRPQGELAGEDPPAWAMQPIPVVTVVGRRIGDA